MDLEIEKENDVGLTDCLKLKAGASVPQPSI